MLRARTWPIPITTGQVGLARVYPLLFGESNSDDGSLDQALGWRSARQLAVRLTELAAQRPARYVLVGGGGSHSAIAASVSR